MQKKSTRFKDVVPDPLAVSRARAASTGNPGSGTRGFIDFLTPWPRRAWMFCLLLAAITIIVYLPALHGGFVWDDDSWTTKITDLLRDTSGLRLMWFQPTALQQYYPLSGTTFWLDYHLWNFWTTPYHVENVLLHTLAALLFWRLLLRLQLPGAWLASALFALHPVMVESVAWITERKNVLSMVFYLGALLAYERYAPWVTGTGEMASAPNASRGRWRPSLFYSLAFVLFLGALLAKTTAFSLPAVILLIGWWKRGQIRWRADVLPTLPFFALALGLCAVTDWLEKNHLGAQGPDFALTFPQRCLIAGHAFWFYLGKLLWPADLCFVYPQWHPNPGSVWQWLYPVTAIGTLFTFWRMRGRIGRGPVTALFYFVGTLSPLLGFMNAYGMRYSFVWDHWIYLPALGIIALVAALAVRAAESLRTPAVVYGFAAIVLPAFALLTWQQAGIYIDKETLWHDTLAKNPDCWMAHYNLGIILNLKGQPDEAIGEFQEAIRLKPDNTDARINLGFALYNQGQIDEAIGEFQEVIRLKPDNTDARNDLGIALLNKNQIDEAISQFQEAIRLKPDNAAAHQNLGDALGRKGQIDEAISQYQEAIRRNADNAAVHHNLGDALGRKGQIDEAISQYQEAIRLKPDYTEAYFNLGDALAVKGKFDEAIENYRQAIQINSNRPEIFVHLGMTLGQLGRTGEAVTQYREALRLNPDLPLALNNLAWELATSPDDQLRNGAEAVRLAEHACELTHYDRPLFIGTLAAAYAEAGRFPEAVAASEKAHNLALALGRQELALKNQELLQLFKNHQPYREKAGPSN
jgi:tetratricopeptide (TPR) repeat protein